MLKDTLKQEIDNLNEEQLKKIADFVATIKAEKKPEEKAKPLWQRATPKERSQDFKEWVAQLPHGSPSLTDEAFDRESIYD